MTEEPTAFYGLPTHVEYCKRCVLSNQRPNSAVEYKHTADSKKKTVHFNEEGVCDACKFAEQKNSIDWDAREKQLRELCDKHRSTDGSYDCVVPGSGGKDSFYAAHKLKYEYGMHPITVTWAPHLYTPWGWANFQAWIHAGFDNELHTPNGRVHRLLTRLAVENIFHPFQPFMIGQKAMAPTIAAKMKIPLIFYGENEAEYGNPIEDTTKAQRSWDYFTSTNTDEIFLSGVSMTELQQRYQLSKNDLVPYMPADPQQLSDINAEVHYLGYYLRWHPQSCYYYSVEHAGFQASPERTAGTYSKYNSIDDKIDDFHYYTTYIKFGLGRATYDAAQEIRSGDITREEGVALVHKFDGEYPDRFEKEIFEYLSVPEKDYGDVSKEFDQPIMTRDSFMSLAEQFRSPHLWKKEGDEWKQRYIVS